MSDMKRLSNIGKDPDYYITVSKKRLQVSISDTVTGKHSSIFKISNKSGKLFKNLFPNFIWKVLLKGKRCVLYPLCNNLLLMQVDNMELVFSCKIMDDTDEESLIVNPRKKKKRKLSKSNM